MTRISRRSTLALGGAAALAHPALGQSDQRPSITVAVQKISNTNTLETLREQSNVGSRTFTSYGETLIEVDWIGDLSLRPMLAESWRRVDGRTVELSLRRGVRFHDGREMTAEDVVFAYGPERMGWNISLDQARNLFGAIPGQSQGRTPPPEALAIARRGFPAFEKVEAVNSHTVRFINRVDDVTLEGRISRNIGMVVSPAAFQAASTWLDYARRPVGTGPYRVGEYRPDHSLILESHDDYWGGLPPLRRIRFLEVPEVSSRINMLISGEADFATDIPPDQIRTVERSVRHEVVGGPIMNHRLTCFDKNHPVLRDARVRRAFTHAIDRRMIVDGLWAGRAPVPRGLQFDFYGAMLQRDWEAPRFDAGEARRLLREAGYRGEAIPYRLLSNYYTNQVSTAQVLVEGWRQAGLNVVIEMRENFPQVLSRDGQRAVRDWSNSASFNDPVSSLVAQHGPDGQQWQIGEWQNEEFGTLSRLLETSTDHEQRRRTFRRMLEIAEREDPAFSVLHQSVNLTAKRRDLRWRPGQSFGMDFRARNWGVTS